MYIQNIEINNFRGYKSLKCDLDSKFNLIIGENGSGKTAILEALTVAIGSFFLGIKGVSTRGVLKNDIHIATYEHNEEYLFPVTIEVEGVVGNQTIQWQRSKNGLNNSTTSKDANSIKDIAIKFDSQVRNGEDVDLPLLMYYATGRLFNIANDTKDLSPSLSSRFRAYNRSLEAKSTHKQFQSWFRGKELSRIQKNRVDSSFEIVKETIIKSLPNCLNIYYEFDPDRPKGLKIEFNDGRILPFKALSDGTRNFFAIIADMAYKSIILNPHLEDKAIEMTKGVVLIDELDLHLHPAWQREIITILRSTFPNIQFIATTHSPFLIQETGEEQLIILKNNNIEKITSGINLSIEDIAEELQEVINPQWSKSRQEMFEKAKVYYQAVKEKRDTPQMKEELDKAMRPFGLDTAYYAIIEQEKIIQQYENGQK